MFLSSQEFISFDESKENNRYFLKYYAYFCPITALFHISNDRDNKLKENTIKRLIQNSYNTIGIVLKKW